MAGRNRPLNATEAKWNVMTRTRGGAVSLMKDLTEDQARGLMQRLHRPLDRGNPWDINYEISIERQARIATALGHNSFSMGGGSHYCTDGDLQQIECWGPPGETLDVWPKPADWDERWTEALAALDAEMEANPPKKPPPPPPPINAEDHGLPAGLRIERDRDTSWRCGECNVMQKPSALGAWLPDSITKRDSRDDLIRVLDEQRWNGHSSLWCLDCCKPWRVTEKVAGKSPWWKQ